MLKKYVFYFKGLIHPYLCVFVHFDESLVLFGSVHNRGFIFKENVEGGMGVLYFGEEVEFLGDGLSLNRRCLVMGIFVIFLLHEHLGNFIAKLFDLRFPC
jgi:hypothetical protein